MKRTFGMIPLVIALWGTGAPASIPLNEHVQSVPGFADFLAVDGDTAWVTNDGRVEQWSKEGKRASVAVPKPCGSMAIAFGSLWVANCKGGNLYRIDPKTADIQAIIAMPIANPLGELNVVEGAGSIWVPSEDTGVVARVDPATNTVTEKIAVDPGTFFLTFGFGSVWAVSSAKQSLQRIDPQANKVVDRIAMGKQPGFLAAGEGAVWVQEQGDGTVARVDPQTVAVSGRVKVGKTLTYGDIDTGSGTVWLRTTEDQTFVAIDPISLTILIRAGKVSGSGALRYTPSGIWTTAHDLKTMSWWTDKPGETK